MHEEWIIFFFTLIAIDVVQAYRKTGLSIYMTLIIFVWK